MYVDSDRQVTLQTIHVLSPHPLHGDCFTDFDASGLLRPRAGQRKFVAFPRRGLRSLPWYLLGDVDDPMKKRAAL